VSNSRQGPARIISAALSGRSVSVETRPARVSSALGVVEDVRGTGENELSGAPVVVYDAFQCQGNLRQALNLVDDDRQLSLSKLAHKGAELPVRLPRQRCEKTLVVEVKAPSRLDHVADQSRFPRLPGTDDIDNASRP
jgi:hypothetical protein